MFYIAEGAEILRRFAHGTAKSRAQPMIAAEGHSPARQTDADFFDGELEEHLGENFFYLLLAYLEAVHGHDGHAVFIGQRRRHIFDFFGLGIRAVQKHNKRFFETFQLGYYPALGFFVFAARNLAYRAVGRYDKTYCRMFADDLLRAYLRRHIERYLMLEPRGFYHSRTLALDIAEGTRDNISHAVYEPHAECRLRLQRYLDCVFGDEFRLGGHYSASRRGLRKLIGRAVAHALALDIRQNEGIHETLYKC